MTAGDAVLIFSHKVGSDYYWNVLAVSETMALVVYSPTGERFTITVRADD